MMCAYNTSALEVRPDRCLGLTAIEPCPLVKLQASERPSHKQGGCPCSRNQSQGCPLTCTCMHAHTRYTSKQLIPTEKFVSLSNPIQYSTSSQDSRTPSKGISCMVVPSFLFRHSYLPSMMMNPGFILSSSSLFYCSSVSENILTPLTSWSQPAPSLCSVIAEARSPCSLRLPRETELMSAQGPFVAFAIHRHQSLMHDPHLLGLLHNDAHLS